MSVFRTVPIAIVLLTVVTTTWFVRHSVRDQVVPSSKAETERPAKMAGTRMKSDNETGSLGEKVDRERVPLPAETTTVPWNALLDRAIAIYRNKSAKPGSEMTLDTQALADLDEAVAHDAAVRRGLMERWRLASDALERRVIMNMLSRYPGTDTASFARQLIDGSDPTERRSGFDLLLYGPRDAETYRFVAQALAREQDPTIVTGVVATLAKSGQSSSTYGEPLLDRLLALTASDDTAIRRASLQALGRGDQNARIDSTLKQALFDSREEIRVAAASAIGANSERAESMKPELTTIVRNTQETRATRLAALDTLRRLRLTSDETAEVARIGHELGR